MNHCTRCTVNCGHMIIVMQCYRSSDLIFFSWINISIVLFFLFLFQKAKSNCLCMRCFFSHWNGFTTRGAIFIFCPVVALFCDPILQTGKAVLLTVHMLVVFNMEEDKVGLKSCFLIGQI